MRTQPRKIIRTIAPSEYSELNIPPNIRKAIVYLTNTKRGYSCGSRFVTIPLFATQKTRGYFLYYIAHELSHIAEHINYGKGRHNKGFYQCFKTICPVELQFYELRYKPQGAKVLYD